MRANTDEPEERALEGITHQQQILIDRLLTGMSIHQAARLTGVSRRTVTYWLDKGPVRLEYNRQRFAMSEQFRTRIANLHEKALSTLECCLGDESPPMIRFQAAKFLYEAHLQQASNVHWPIPPSTLVKKSANALMRDSETGYLLWDDRGNERLPDRD